MYKMIPLVAWLAVGLMASTTMAQSLCDDRDVIIELLAKKFQETTIAAGVTTSGGLVEVLTGPKQETWTIIVTSPQGMSCLIATGEGWRSLDQITLDPEA